MELNLQEVIAAVGGKCLNPKKLDDTKIKEITTDSRQHLQQSLFIPLKGERFDAHDFIQSVYEKGAVATLTMNEKVQDPRLCTIYVKDTNRALLDLACFYRKKFEIPVVGITGSVGKTSTKEIIAAVLSGKFNVHKTEGNFNNEIGLPLTLFRLRESHKAAVIEMGMNHFGEIHNLSTCALPQVGVITNIGTSHIENLGSREGILKAKLELLDGLATEGLLVVNGDNDLLEGLKDLPIHTVFYGLSEKNDYFAKNIRSEGEYTSADISTPRGQYTICIRALGEHMIYNTLAAIAVAEYYGLTEEEIKIGLSYYTPTKMRMHITVLENEITVIDDTYNASPDSMCAALKVLRDYETSGKRIAVLGDMFEMGKFAPDLHEKVGISASELNIDVLCAVGQLATHIFEGYQKHGGKEAYYYKDKEAFIQDMKNRLQAGDTVLFKASRGMHFEEMLASVGKVK